MDITLPPTSPSSPTPSTTSQSASHARRGEVSGGKLPWLSVLALGVVFGDLGTSPLYTLQACFQPAYGLAATRGNVVGVLSLIFWSLVIVVSIKYLTFVLRADNRGEGGILALMSLVTPGRTLNAGWRQWGLICLGLFGAALLYGDGVITPAITVLSAMEGLTIAAPGFDVWVVPITIIILIVLFGFQRFGTAKVGMVFGPVMLIWFVVLGLLGIWHIVGDPEIFWALSPISAVRFFAGNGVLGFFILGFVVLALTGAEALYADLGHFGRGPIRLSWFALVFPALLLNYFGQGALLLNHPSAVSNPFYQMVPGWAVYPMIVLAALATIIASQAIISGAYSLTMQAVQFGFSPRMLIRHTSPSERGQIYMPLVNWTLMIVCIALVIGFGSSANLAAAYGVAVSTTMVITTMLFFVFLRQQWHWRWWTAGGLCSVLLVIDLAFCAANLLKIPEGGWVPLALAGAVFALMSTWKRGREILGTRLAAGTVSFDTFRESIRLDMPHRVPGTAVFMQGNPRGTPSALLHNLKHNKVLHERVVLLNIRTEEVPRVWGDESVKVEDLGEGFHRVVASFGFMDDPNMPVVLKRAEAAGLALDAQEVTFFLGGRTLVVTHRRGMMYWRKMLFAWMLRNERGATAFFHLPPNRVVEFGVQIEL